VESGKVVIISEMGKIVDDFEKLNLNYWLRFFVQSDIRQDICHLISLD